MSNYEKQNFQSGQILTAAQLNHIEDGIEKVLPLVENTNVNQFLFLDKDGTLQWKEEDYGWTLEDQLLYEEFDLSIGRVTPLLKPEVGDLVTATLNGEIFQGNVRLDSVIGDRIVTLTNGEKQIFFGMIEPGVESSIVTNPSSLSGVIKVMVKTKKYKKLDYKYLPICSVEGEAYNSINLNNTSNAKASSPISVAANYGKAQGMGSFAINTGSTFGYWSFAEGFHSAAKGLASHAEGRQTIAASDYQHAEGKFNIEDTENKYAHIIGNGTAKDTRSNAHTLDWDGNAWFAGTMEGTAMIIKSPNGTRFQITVSDDGTLSATAITE